MSAGALADGAVVGRRLGGGVGAGAGAGVVLGVGWGVYGGGVRAGGGSVCGGGAVMWAMGLTVVDGILVLGLRGREKAVESD